MRRVDLKELRDRLGLSQAAFARRYRLTRDAVRGWELGRGRSPSTELLLVAIEHDPDGIAELSRRLAPAEGSEAVVER